MEKVYGKKKGEKRYNLMTRKTKLENHVVIKSGNKEGGGGVSHVDF